MIAPRRLVAMAVLGLLTPLACALEPGIDLPASGSPDEGDGPLDGAGGFPGSSADDGLNNGGAAGDGGSAAGGSAPGGGDPGTGGMAGGGAAGSPAR